MKRWLIISAAIVMAVLFSWRYAEINRRYPDPLVYAAGVGETMQIGGYNIWLSSAEHYDGSYLHELFPRRTGGTEASYDEHVLLAQIAITNTDNDDTYIDLSEITVESGAWHNHFDMEVFSALNPGISMKLNIGESETASIVIPIIMHKDSFPDSEWVSILDRPVSLVFGCYPDKYILKL